MALPGIEPPLAVLAREEPPAPPAPRVVATAAPPRARRLSFWLYWAHLAGLFGLAVSNVFLAAAVLATPFSGRLHVLAARPKRPFLVVLAVYVALLLMAIATSFDPHHSLREAGELFSLVALLVGLVVMRGEREVRLAIDAILVLASFEAVVGLVQLAIAGGADLAHRIRGTTSHYMTFAGILMIADLLLCAQILRPGGLTWRRAGWRGLVFLAINAALVGSLTRSAWVGTFAGVAALMLLSRRRVLLWSVPAMLLLFLLLPGPVLQRAISIADPADPTNSDRLCMAKAGIAMIRERPLVGQGPGMVQERYQLFRVPGATRAWVPHLHDGFLEVAAERGLPALAAFLALLGLPLGRALLRYHREGGRSGPRADIWLGVVAAIVGFSVAGLFEDNWGDTEVQRLVLVLLAVPFVLEAVGATGGAGREPAAPLAAPGAPRPPAAGPIAAT